MLTVGLVETKSRETGMLDSTFTIYVPLDVTSMLLAFADLSTPIQCMVSLRRCGLPPTHQLFW